MKIRLGDLRRIIREAVGEGEGLAAYVTEEHGGFKATVYNSAAVENLLRKSLGYIDDETMAKLKRYTVGRVQVLKPMDPCWDAMMIASIAGPGKLMYGVAYALSPSGLLISDRDSMTSDALSAWKRMAAKADRGKKELDDVNEPATPDPYDDCELRPEEFLNHAYEAQGWEKVELRSMQEEHERLMKTLTATGKLTRLAIELAISAAGLSYFQTRYREALQG